MSELHSIYSLEILWLAQGLVRRLNDGGGSIGEIEPFSNVHHDTRTCIRSAESRLLARGYLV